MSEIAEFYVAIPCVLVGVILLICYVVCGGAYPFCYDQRDTDIDGLSPNDKEKSISPRVSWEDARLAAQSVVKTHTVQHQRFHAAANAAAVANASEEESRDLLQKQNGGPVVNVLSKDVCYFKKPTLHNQ